MKPGTTKKLYPFSLVKHAHDVEFRYNRLKNLESDYFAGTLHLTLEQYSKLETELKRVTKAYEIMLSTPSNGRVLWIDGETYSVLIACVYWATNERDHKNR